MTVYNTRRYSVRSANAGSRLRLPQYLAWSAVGDPSEYWKSGQVLGVQPTGWSQYWLASVYQSYTL